MQEYFDKYNSFERVETLPTIDNPIIVILGLTVTELALGTLLFVLLGLLGDAPFLGITLGLSTSFFLKHYRRSLPRGALQHSLWSLGLPCKKGVFQIFKRARIKTLEP